MGISNFIVKLDEPDATYSPGSTVSGTVQLTVSGEEQTHGIWLKFIGLAVTKKLTARRHLHGGSSYSSSHYGYGPHYCDTHYHHHHNNGPSLFKGKQRLVEHRKLLFGDDINPETIPVGEHSFPFSFEFPPQPLPPSYEVNSLNFITYKLGAYIAKPWYRSDIRTEITRLRVVTPFDLNHRPWTKTPTSKETSKKFGMFWWAYDPLMLNIKINPSGFCLGDEIPVTVEIDNKSQKNLKDVKMELIREWKLSAKPIGDIWDVWPYENWSVPEVVKSIQRGEAVPAASTANWDALLLVPPNELPTLDETACDIFKLSYKIKVTACVDAMLSWNLDVELPVTIGTVPFK